ncbi:hypothetical protein FKW77_004842 [Venturia effusa]|uniref:Protein AF-9 homolog n=1 Tax=Venturia effusa TaxID=50376 RepID=A0A517L192_9PEZI|nr:hypothetical protein FKW77_004842 [Venturia effusa]
MVASSNTYQSEAESPPSMTKQLKENLGKAWEPPKQGEKRSRAQPARLSESNINFSPQPSPAPTPTTSLRRDSTKEVRKPFDSPKKFEPPSRKREQSPEIVLTMSTNKSNRRVKNKRISRPFIIGTTAHKLTPLELKNPKNQPNATSGWTVYVRPVPNGPAITPWLKKVTFILHETFPNSSRTVENVNPATGGFELEETAYGGFFINIKLYFQSYAGEKWQQRQVYLFLEPFDSGLPVKPGEETQSQRQIRENKIVSETVEFIEFNEPTDQLWDQLTSDTQWDYLKPQAGQRGKGKGRASMGNTDVRAARPLDVSSLNATELPARGPEGQLWSKEAEDLIVAQMEMAGEEADKALAKTMERSKDLNNLLNTLKEGAAIDEKLKELFETIPPRKR